MDQCLEVCVITSDWTNEQFKQALASAMPGILTGGKPARQKPADELAALAGKDADGSATDADKARLRKLAAAL